MLAEMLSELAMAELINILGKQVHLVGRKEERYLVSFCLMSVKARDRRHPRCNVSQGGTRRG